MRLILLILIIGLIVPKVYSKTVIINNKEAYQNLSPEITFIKDYSRKKSAQDILIDFTDTDSIFKFPSNKRPTFIADGFVWGMFSLTNESNSDLFKILEMDSPYLDSVLLYEVHDKSPKLIGLAGDWVLLKDRQTKTRTRTFELIIPQNTTNTYLFTFRRPRKNIVPINLYNPLTYHSKIANQNLIFGLFLGGFFVLILYSLIIFIINKKRLFFLYAIYLLVTVLGVSYSYGFTYRYIFYNLSSYSDFLNISTALWILCFILLTLEFLEVKKYSAKLFTYAKFILYLFITVVLITNIGYAININFPALPITYITLTTILSGIIILIVKMYSKNKTATIFYMLSFAPVIIAIIVFILIRINVFESAFLDDNMFLIASFSEMLIISVGIANKIRLESKEKLNLSLQLVKQERELFTKIEESNAEQKANIAHTLHDSFGARLKQIRSLIETSELSNAQQKLILLGNDIRDLSHAMSPTILDHLTLHEAITDFIESLHKPDSKLSIYSYNNDNFKLSKQIKTVLYNITVEIINNGLKHASANHINIQLGVIDNTYTITIEDDGIGFDTEHTKNGIGVQSIRARILNLGGSCTIESAIKKGSVYLIEVPLG